MHDIMVIVSPVFQQVIQRDKRNRSKVRISGSLLAKFDSIEVRTTVAEGCAGEAMEWHNCVFSRNKKQFEASVSLPAGGWYALELRAKMGKRVVARGSVQRVGIGEVFAITGQSNAANWGEGPLQVSDERVVAYNEGAWQKANDPQPGSDGVGGSWVPLLGTLLAQSLQVPIGFVGSAMGGSALAWWFPFPHRKDTPDFPGTPKDLFYTPAADLKLYDNLLRRTRAQGKHGIRAILWHQGESDAVFNTTPSLYCEGVRYLSNELNKDLGYRLPWVVARASYHTHSTRKQQRSVVAGQRLAWQKGVALQGPSTDDLLGAKHRHDTVHLSALGLQIHASRWFAALWAHFWSDMPMVLAAHKAAAR